MDFGLTDDQQMLAETARQFLSVEASPRAVRRVAEDPQGFSPELNRKVAEQGWVGLLVPESHGGLGLGMLDAAVLLGELGRTLAPVPFLSSGVLATTLLLAAGSTAQKKTWLPRLASGETFATVAWLEESERLDPAGVALRARRARDRLRLSGAKRFVVDAQVADLLLVAARTGSGTGAAGMTLLAVPRDTPGVSIVPLPSLDSTRQFFAVAFDNAAVSPS
ncbi:MAG: acyl-CoA dehydrogenase family protein, partial [Alphaproteobacteria bacterium]